MFIRKILCLLSVLFIIGAYSTETKAAPIDNQDGTITQIRNDPTYGDGSRLMWLKDVNTAGTSGYPNDPNYPPGQMTWDESNTWIGTLNSSNYLGYDDWQLPRTLPVNGSNYNTLVSYDGSTDIGFNITSPNSEMAYMYYVELGNLGEYDTSGNPQPGWGLLNTGSFDNLQPDLYWSGTDATFDPRGAAWWFAFYNGSQSLYGKNTYRYAWAVRDVAAVPEPGTLLLVGTGLSGMALFRRRTLRRHG